MGVTDLYTQHRRSPLSFYLCLVVVTRRLRLSARLHQGYMHSVRAQKCNTYDEAGRSSKLILLVVIPLILLPMGVTYLHP